MRPQKIDTLATLDLARIAESDPRSRLGSLRAIARLIWSAEFEGYSRFLRPGFPYLPDRAAFENLQLGFGGFCGEKAGAFCHVLDSLGIKNRLLSAGPVMRFLFLDLDDYGWLLRGRPRGHVHCLTWGSRWFYHRPPRELLDRFRPSAEFRSEMGQRKTEQVRRGVDAMADRVRVDRRWRSKLVKIYFSESFPRLRFAIRRPGRGSL